MERYFCVENPENCYLMLYPHRHATLPLQQLGRLAGWHHDSPFKVGVNAQWGPWFAYRAAVLADTDFAPTAPMFVASPCEQCTDSPCLSACPAISGSGDIRLDDCIDVRLACPVRPEHRYGDDQMAYHYGRSLEILRGYRMAD